MRILPKVLSLKIHRLDFHVSFLNGGNAVPLKSTSVGSAEIDTIQVAIPTPTVPPGSFKGRVCRTVK